MKKNIALILLSILTLTSCGKYTFENSSYDKGGIINYSKDEDMVLDGLDNEDVYKDLEVFEIYEPEFQTTLSTKVYEGKNGWYFYQHVNDTTVMYSKNKQLYQNDGVELHINVNPDECLSLDYLKRGNKVTESMLQIRISVGEQLQTWVGNNLSGSYEWTMYYKPCEIKVNIDGELNKENGAKGYSVETFIPYKAFNLDAAPEKISIMPAFNNTSSNLDTTRKWFTRKGMAHNFPTSWIKYSMSEGFIYDGKNVDVDISALKDDEKYKDQNKVELIQVDANNKNEVTRGYFKSYYDDKGVYIYSNMYDKVYSRNNDNIWLNDGIEVMIDTNPLDYSDSVIKEGMYRFGFDVDNGVESDIYVSGHNNPIPYYMKTNSKVTINRIDEYTDYGYKYEYIFELFVPFESLHVDTKEDVIINVCFAYKSPYEKAYIKDRRDGFGNMEGQDWLWIDKHYPQNTKEYFRISPLGIV
jgi:hypothetical protein